MTLILRRLEQWSFGTNAEGPRWRRPRRSSYTRLHSSLISRGRETMGGRGLVRDPPEDWTPPPTAAEPTEHPARHVTREDQRAYVKIEALRGRKALDIHASLVEACGDQVVEWSAVVHWTYVFASESRSHAEQRCPGYGRLATAVARNNFL